MIRNVELATDEIYHVYNQSIADYRVFNSDGDFVRFKQMLLYFMYASAGWPSFSHFMKSYDVKTSGLQVAMSKHRAKGNASVQIIAYCVMQTHFHLVLKQLIDNGISRFVSNLENAYARYFNVKHNRKGPLWAGAFGNVRVKSDEQLLHVTRYVHLNPVTHYLCDRPEDWRASSYLEYTSPMAIQDRICDFEEFIDMTRAEYREFVYGAIEEQRELAIAKK